MFTYFYGAVHVAGGEKAAQTEQKKFTKSRN